jgi:hypothetical protein
MMSVKQYAVKSRTWIAVNLLFAAVACGGGDDGAGSGGGEYARLELSEPDAAFPEAFSSIVGIRELNDGRVFVADRLGQALMIVDLAAGTADTIGRVGGGPGEYASPGDLLPWRGDSTLLVDMGNTRFTPVGPYGGFGISMPLMTQDGESMRLVIPEGTDRQGNIYFQGRNFSMGAGGPGGSSDSALVVRWNPESDRTDTVAALRQPERKIQRGGGNVMMMPIPFSPADAWAVSWDGDVGVARGVGYRVEWTDTDGMESIGDEVEYRPIVITQGDKDEWLEARANPAGGGMFITMNAGGGGGGGNVRAAPAPRGARFEGPQVADEDWPEVKPPFLPSEVSATPEGQLWVQRYVSLGASPEYDVFDGNGNLVRTVVLAANSRVVGFGNGVVYVARTDEDDLQWLERFIR